ncbi:serine/threonine-protein kinase-like protein At3g51990 [Magnolia sinica]|uniref:serine/threonine-protein kinase-like protein At3g51990 n=1 Tax=Magnolia sinica TaxID=86752 RepID=UPI002659AF0C|nr:serine/threonine-protein kinase-like protein At3g51990 [Magnolia sinica]
MGFLSCNSKSSVSTSNPKKKKPRTKTNPIRQFRYEDLESATRGFSSDYLLGRGSHGTVYKAIMDGGKLVVAVKKAITTRAAVENTNSKDNNQPAENEIEILSRIQNPGFVNLLGYSLDSNERKLIVVEFMANGTLYDYLHSNWEPPDWGRRIRFALQIAEAVSALHSSDPPVIHRDIKSSNILIDENWNARLGDFGLALRGHVEDVRIRSTPPAGTLGYIDPGYVEPEDLSTKSDVFSFGILLLEILSARNAIDMNYSPPSIVDWAAPLIKKGEFDVIYDPRIGPPSDASVGRQLAILADRCVGPIAGKRPSMGDMVSCLRNVSKKFRSPIWSNFKDRIWKTGSTVDGTIESVEEMGNTVKYMSRNSLRNRKVSNVQSGVDSAEQ